MWIVILQYLTQAEVTVYFSDRVRTRTAADSRHSDHRHGGLRNKQSRSFTSVLVLQHMRIT
jgi:hypothetical protein